jgi:hypothetical protein
MGLFWLNLSLSQICFISELCRRLDHQGHNSLQQAFAPGTHRNLALHKEKYFHLCSLIMAKPWPVSSDTLCRYTSCLAQHLNSVDSIGHYIQGIKNWSLLSRYDITAFSSLRLKLILCVLGGRKDIKFVKPYQ